MKQSIKIDIIYFGVERDTKMEFCFNDFDKMPVRTLATAAEGRDDFLYALKRAVYRSDIVIVVGGLSSKIYIPGIIGAAVGATAEKVDYKALGFAEPAQPLVFPKGAIPLVTPNNHIGGMLLEKGRQSIIVLSEDATIRHQLLEELIYPYIFDVEMEDNSNVIYSSSAAVPEETIAEEPKEEAITEATVAEPAEELPAAEEAVPVEMEAAEEIAEEVAEEPAVEEIAEEAEATEIIEEFTEQAIEEADEEAPIGNEEGLFVVVDDGSDELGDEEDEEFVAFKDFVAPLADETLASAEYTGYQYDDAEDELPYADRDIYAPERPSVAKILGIIVALLCIGASAAIFMLVILGLI